MIYINKSSAEDDSNRLKNSDENNDMGKIDLNLIHIILQYCNNNNVIDLFSKCFDGIGCIDTDARWYDKKYRPVNLRPAERHIIKTDFLLIKPSREVSYYYGG